MTQSPSVSLFDLRPDLRPAYPGDPVVVAGDLILSNTSITHLPAGLSVFGSLELSDVPITELPQGMCVGENLILYRTLMTQLPNDISVGGDLDVICCLLTQLPEGLSVPGNLCLRGSSLLYLPQRLSIGGELDFRGTCITHLPKDICVQGKIFPPDTLEGLLHFRATLTERVQLQGAHASAHATAHILQRLAPYPEMVRVWQSIPADRHWTIMPLFEPPASTRTWSNGPI